VFGALLDHERGGHFRVRPADEQYRTRQMYLPDSAVLITRFFTDSAVGEVVDFMPVAGEAATDTHRLVRMVRCVRGRMRFAVDVAKARIEDGDVRVSLELEAGQVRGMVLESAADGPPRAVGVAEISGLFDDTVRFWNDWLARST